MLRNYLILALRNLWKNKIFSAINIFGLSIGLATCITILLFVQYERSFDSFHTKNIYRLNQLLTWEGMVQPQKVPLSSYPMASTLKADFSEVRNTTHFHLDDNSIIKYNEQKILLKKVLWVDSNFFKLFDFKLENGHINEAFRNPRAVVLTSENAEKLFGSEDPLGKLVNNSHSMDTLPFVVTGILSIPKNSHLQFDALYSVYPFVKQQGMDQWEVNGMVTYVELNPKADPNALEKKFPEYLQKYRGKDVTTRQQLLLQPLSEIHGSSADITFDFNNAQKFDVAYIKLFSVLALIVLTIGCFNFINLSTARSVGRAKEVGVRKSIGAHRFQLAIQFIGESVLLSIVATFIAIGLVKLFLPCVNELSGHELQISVLTDPLAVFKLIAGAVFIGTISGIYPALYLSAFNAAKVLKGTFVANTKSITRNVLIVVQFAGAAFLIIASIFILRQLNFMQNRDAGFNRDQVVMLPGAYGNWYRLKEELLKSTLIKSVSGSTQKLGNSLHQTWIRLVDYGPERGLATSHALVDYDFLRLYEIKLVAGENFTREGEGKEFILNETLARELLKDEPQTSIESLIDKRLLFEEDSASTIVGVCRDFNFNSLHHKIETLCLYNKKKWGYSDVCVKIDGTRTTEALAYIESIWEKSRPHFPFEYQFLDDHFASLYDTDKKVSRVISILAGLAIIIACLGLLGLVSYTAQRRVKEIGIRKVLGSSVLNIVALLSKDFVKLVVLANIIAWPLGWWLVTKWLQNFAYRIDIDWWVFIFAGAISISIALITISVQIIKAARSNPTKNLRTE